jgi:hypothetical protein
MAVAALSCEKAQPPPSDVVVTLERTSCFGECPVYTVSIDRSGNVAYEGKQSVRVKGHQVERIQASRVAALLETAERIGFFDFLDQYHTVSVTDLPTTIVTIVRDGRSKWVVDYTGAPSGLKDLEEQIDEIAGTKRWIRIDEPTLRRLLSEGAPPSVEERAEMLRKALQHDEVSVVKALIEIGADPNFSYYGTHTRPLMMARSAAATRALLDAGATALAQNDNGWTPLGHAVYLAPEVTEVLIKAGAPVDQPTDADGRTALWGAACLGNAGVVALLVRAGADPTLRPLRPGAMSPLQCARQGKEAARSRQPWVVPEGKAPYIEDFARAIAVLEQALATRSRR